MEPGEDFQSSPTQAIIVLVTTASEEEATTIGRTTVKQGLAACANILALKKSIFQWEGQIVEEQECLMIIKSRTDLFEELSTAVKRLHSYKVPEIIAVPIVKGLQDYLNWVIESTRISG
ncbi:MAG TPA: divalent-cation tolerance protein CutA [Nitrospiraceae bacterium]|nr:divalent-cation tolerance protein CutA [Nitrospiraceae bacterium]